MRRRAFTLLEVLIAIALTLALLGSMFGFLLNLMSTREQVMTVSMRERAADVLIGRLERDLMTCLVGDDQLGAGVDGDATSLRVVARGVAFTAGTADAVERTFADTQLVEFRFDEAAGRLEVRRGDALSSDGAFEQIGEDIFKVRFRYYDGSSWRNSFASLESDRLPVAIDVAIWFDPWPGDMTETAPEDDGSSSGTGDRSSRLATRETFATDRMFDEVEVAILSDLDLDDEPVPDRRRVITIPDARPPRGGSRP